MNWLHFWIRFWANFLIGSTAAVVAIRYNIPWSAALLVALLVGAVAYRPLDVLFPLYKE